MNPTQKQDTTTATPPADITPAVILRGAARYLDLHGWTQGVYYGLTDDTAFPAACAVGAISMAIYGNHRAVVSDGTEPDRADWRLLNRTKAVLVDFLDLADPPPWDTRDDYHGYPYTWNDRPSRTAEQVVTTLRAAADHYDRTHTPTGGVR